MTNTASGRPAPRYGAWGVLLVTTDAHLERRVADPVRPQHVADRVVRLDDAPGVVRALVEQEPVPERDDGRRRASRPARRRGAARASGSRSGGARCRVSIHFTGRPSRAATTGIRTSSGIDRALRPEPAADVGRDDPQLVGRQAERLAERALEPVRHLGRGPHGEPVAARRRLGQDAARLDRHPRVARHADARLARARARPASARSGSPTRASNATPTLSPQASWSSGAPGRQPLLRRRRPPAAARSPRRPARARPRRRTASVATTTATGSPT